MSTQLHRARDTCPSCGQEIPLEKIEEIRGKIALRERGQALTITMKLEQQHQIEMVQAQSKAIADLDLERRESAARVAAAREKAERAAEALVNQKLEEAEGIREEQQATWQKQLKEAEAARKTAHETEANLRAQLQQLRRETSAALEAANAKNKAREAEIRTEASRAGSISHS
jgi:DNA repair exonuclease SbcCD ATPase subunit